MESSPVSPDEAEAACLSPSGRKFKEVRKTLQRMKSLNKVEAFVHATANDHVKIKYDLSCPERPDDDRYNVAYETENDPEYKPATKSVTLDLKGQVCAVIGSTG